MKFNPRAYVAGWLKLKGITVDERGGLTSPDKREFNDIFDTLFLDYLEQVAAYNKVMDKEGKIKTGSDAIMGKALNEFISLEMTKRRDELTQSLVCETEDITPIKNWVKAVTGNEEPHVVAIMAHFIWQIKRRLNDKEVVWHTMPIIFGGQGLGKSVAIDKLLAPLTNLILRIRVTELTDPRFYFSLNKNYVAFLDEMSGANKADVEVLKSQVSTAYNDARKLNTNNVMKIRQNCSLIGATNRSVSELIYDPTGNRRFFEIRTSGTIDRDLINSIDYKALYKGIDERRERGYREEHEAAISGEQAALVVSDDITTFMEECAISSDGKTKEISSNDLYDKYTQWAESNGIKQPNNNIWLGIKLSNRKIPKYKRRVGSKLLTFYLVNEASSVHSKSMIGDPLSAERGLS